MNLLYIIYTNAIDAEVIEIIQRYGNGYTKFENVQGEGSGEPHLGNHTWPSLNNCIITLVEKTAEEQIVTEIKKIKEKYPTICAKTFSTKVNKIH